MGPHSDKHLLYADWNKRDSTLLSRAQFEKDINDNYITMTQIGLTIDSAKYFMPAYEWYNNDICNWTQAMGINLVNFTSGTFTNADYTTPDMKNYRSSQNIIENVLKLEQMNGLNGSILLIHIGTHPLRTDKFYNSLDKLIIELKKRGYNFLRIDGLLDQTN
jgi:peptidoglycan/xylan/chitin deacetylase (PgdA/CDA1 family)